MRATKPKPMKPEWFAALPGADCFGSGKPFQWCNVPVEGGILSVEIRGRLHVILESDSGETRLFNPTMGQFRAACRMLGVTVKSFTKGAKRESISTASVSMRSKPTNPRLFQLIRDIVTILRKQYPSRPGAFRE